MVAQTSASYRGVGTVPTSTMNWLRSAGKTVTVTRMGFPVSSKPVRKTSNTVASWGIRKKRLPAGHELHGVEGCLERPRNVIDKALLVSADHLCADLDSQPTRDLWGRRLDFYARRAYPRPPVLVADGR